MSACLDCGGTECFCAFRSHVGRLESAVKRYLVALERIHTDAELAEYQQYAAALRNLRSAVALEEVSHEHDDGHSQGKRSNEEAGERK